MIKPDQIPDDVVAALGAALGNLRPTWDYAEAIAAALNAWPNVCFEDPVPGGAVAGFILPMPQEDVQNTES
jgi:hypothetical protein